MGIPILDEGVQIFLSLFQAMPMWFKTIIILLVFSLFVGLMSGFLEQYGICTTFNYKGGFNELGAKTYEVKEIPLDYKIRSLLVASAAKECSACYPNGENTACKNAYLESIYLPSYNGTSIIHVSLPGLDANYTLYKKLLISNQTCSNVIGSVEVKNAYNLLTEWCSVIPYENTTGKLGLAGISGVVQRDAVEVYSQYKDNDLVGDRLYIVRDTSMKYGCYLVRRFGLQNSVSLITEQTAIQQEETFTCSGFNFLDWKLFIGMTIFLGLGAFAIDYYKQQHV